MSTSLSHSKGGRVTPSRSTDPRRGGQVYTQVDQRMSGRTWETDGVTSGSGMDRGRVQVRLGAPNRLCDDGTPKTPKTHTRSSPQVWVRHPRDHRFPTCGCERGVTRRFSPVPCVRYEPYTVVITQYRHKPFRCPRPETSGPKILTGLVVHDALGHFQRSGDQTP